MRSPKYNSFTAVQGLLDNQEHKALIGGQWITAADGAVLTTRDPGTGNRIAEIPAMGAVEVDQAVAAATEAFQNSQWSALTAVQRAKLLLRFADEIEIEIANLAHIESLDGGKILSQAEADVQNLIDTLRYFVEVSLNTSDRTPLKVPGYEAATFRRAWGPCGFIIPWNFPLLLIGWNVAPALAAGNTVIIKPAEDTSLSALYLAAISERAGIPAGVINIVTGYGHTAGAALASHQGLKRLSFTGSTEVGRKVGMSCGTNLTPTKLELGGKGAAVIFDDVDIEETATRLTNAITLNAGQVCCNATRWLVHEQIYSQFIDCCIRNLKQIRIGYQLDPMTQMGPVVNLKQKERILGYIEKATNSGAELLLAGGEATVEDKKGFYIRPALLAGTLDNVAAKEEIFGPVAYLTSFADENQAVNMANETVYGLANSVWTSDLNRANRIAERLMAGNSWINVHNVFPHGVPYGGIKSSGMGGGVLSVDTFLEYKQALSVVRPV